MVEIDWTLLSTETRSCDSQCVFRLGVTHLACCSTEDLVPLCAASSSAWFRRRASHHRKAACLRRAEERGWIQRALGIAVCQAVW